jgi:hypothetical protein
MYFYGQSKEDAPGNHSVTINTAFESFVLSGLGWTTTPPTEPGWYWAWCEGDTAPVCLNIMITEGGIPLTLRTILVASEFTHWLGPLPVPEPPKG